MVRSDRRLWIAGALLLAAMVALMWRPIHEENATDDEPRILAAGYYYWKGYGFRMHQGEPPLAEMWGALPLLAMDITISREAKALLNNSFSYPLARTWSAELKPVRVLSPAGRDNWYLWPWYEGARLGELLVYRDNHGERFLVAARLMQVALTVFAGALIFLWSSEFAGPRAGLFALAMWCFNPVVLAHGHLVQTDAGGALTIVAAMWSYSRFLTVPALRRAVLAGLGLGVALATKLSALALIPTFAVLLIVRRFYTFPAKLSPRDWLKFPIAFSVSAYSVILAVYAFRWGPPPPLSDSQAAVLQVPQWFRTMRIILIPGNFFKDVALTIGSARGKHLSGYLFGEWSTRGWWYYYLVALWLKSPTPWLISSACGLALVAKRIRKVPFEQLLPWIGAAVFLGVAIVNKTNIGVRHLLPMYALLAVGVATQVSDSSRAVRIVSWILCGWMLVVSLYAHPFYIEYFNEFAGGPKNGYRYLLDSNLDWGQDVKRLKQYLERHEIKHVYLEYFGVQQAPEYYGISNTRVSADQARLIHNDILVISAMELMRPEWSWLREQQPPVDRVGYTLFVYKLDS